MTLQPGTRLGEYEIAALIGAGGMGEVYRARDARLGRDVAIKILAPALGSQPDALQRFTREARAAAALNHPHIVAIHDIGTAADGAPYIVSELLEGETLRQKLSGGQLPFPVAVDLACQLAAGLAAAHDKAIVHRDLKPENLFLTADGRLKILDFGLARLMPVPDGSGASAVTAAASPTVAGMVLGTAGYMSPEQVRGEPADHRADVFSFGAVLYEMLSGRRAFAGDTPIQAMTAVLRDVPPAPSTVSGAAPALDRLVQRCLEKAPSDRFQSVRDLEFALKEARGAGTTAPERAAAAVRRGRYRPIAITAIATLLVAAIGAGAYAYFTQLRRPADAAPIGALAVLPLRNLSDDPEQEYFADGMTEALIASLSRVGGVRVISRTSTMTFKAAASTLRLPQIAGQLRVDAVVEGSVIRVGDRVRITVQLVRANTDTPMWSKDYDRDLRDVLGLQSEVARAIAQEIKVTLTPQEQSRLAAAPAVDRLAHEHYLRGRYFLARATEDGLNKAIRAFTASVQADPTSARPHAGLADAYTLLRSTYLPPHLVMPKAKAAAARALELDPDLAEAHVSMGGVLMFYDFDWAGAERELRRAIELAPNLADAHDYYAMYLAAMGRHEEARLESDRAMALDPLSLAILDSAAWDRYLARDYPGGLALAQRALELDPNYWPAMRDAGLLYEKLGRFPEAIAALEKARRLDSNASILEMLAGAYAAWGKEAEARKVLAELTARSASQYVCPYEVATVYASLGDKTAAVDWLEKAHRDRADCMPWTRSDAKLDVIRGYPAFEAIMQRMGFPR